MSLFLRARPRLSSPALRNWTPRIVEVLLNMPAWLRLSKAEAGILAGYMDIQFVPAGIVFIRQDDPSQTDGMMLLLDGEVSVEKSAGQQSDSLVVSIAQPGALLGEMGILNNAPRSATCVAYTDAVLALLTREALERLVYEFPLVGAKLALGIASRLAERLRATSSKLSTLSQVTAAMHPTLDASTLAGGLKRHKARRH